MINPMVVEGQIFGGVVQGMGGVLLEDFVYDDDGNPLTTTFMDYLPPTTSEVPDIEVGHIETESTTNPGGYKGMGEGGAIGAHAAVANAVADALRPLGVKATKTPLGPEQIFALVEAAKDRRPDHRRSSTTVRSSTVTLDRPDKLNALDLEHVLALRDELARARRRRGGARRRAHRRRARVQRRWRRDVDDRRRVGPRTSRSTSGRSWRCPSCCTACPRSPSPRSTARARARDCRSCARATCATRRDRPCS